MEGPVRELLDLQNVHRFYVGLVEAALGHPVPIPQEAAAASAQEHDPLRRWLALLDLAITPPMVRDALREATSYETAEALLRYYIQRGSDVDRDKTDFVVTFLYRKWMVSHGDVADPVHGFEFALGEVLAGIVPPEMPPEHARLVEEFEFLRQEVEDFRHFDALMDAGIVQRVRSIKEALQRSFYHPRALATIASYNAFFGQRFDDLFRKAADQIKTFTAAVQEGGASVMSRVEGDVTVKHMEDAAKDAKVLELEYGRAQEHFRKISRYRKAVEKRMPGVVKAPAPAAANGTPVPPVAAAAAAAPALVRAGGNIEEEARIRSLADFIRNFIRTSQSDRPVVVPIPKGNLVVTPAEADAFRNDYQGEKSFRADYARVLTRLVSVHARLIAETNEYQLLRGASQHLRKPHADALAYLIAAADRCPAEVAPIVETAQQRGLMDKITAVQAALEKLRTKAKESIGVLHS